MFWFSLFDLFGLLCFVICCSGELALLMFVPETARLRGSSRIFPFGEWLPTGRNCCLVALVAGEWRPAGRNGCLVALVAGKWLPTGPNGCLVVLVAGEWFGGGRNGCLRG